MSKQEFIRSGFITPKRGKASWTINAIADAAMKLRMLLRSRKPRMSHVLIYTRKPQAFGDYFNKGKCCTLGVLCEKSNALDERKAKYTTPDWNKFVETFDVTDEELNRMISCPVCGNWNCLLLQMAHLNDKHRWKNVQIGKWLKRYKL